MLRADTHRPLQLRRIRPKIHDGAALIHVCTDSHVRVAVPEQLFVRTIQNISPQRAFRLRQPSVLTVKVRELRHGHVVQLTFLFQLAIICHAVLVGFKKQLVGCLPASHLVHPAGTHKHHIVGITVVVFRQCPKLVNQIVKIRIFPGLRIITHTPQDILRMCAEIGAVTVIAGNQVTG